MYSSDSSSIPVSLGQFERAPPRLDADPQALEDWVGDLKVRGVLQAGPALLQVLEMLRRSELPLGRRLGILSLLKTPVLKVCAGLPKPRAGRGESGLTLEQRLGRLMFVNLDHALHLFDKHHPFPGERESQQRLWLIRNLFRFAGRQIRYVIQYRAALPPGSWRDLHELYLYLLNRRPLALWDLAAEQPVGDGFDYEAEYRQLLLLGLATRLKADIIEDQGFMDRLATWADQTRLDDPHTRLGWLGSYIVESSADEAPRWFSGSLDLPFRGWVLRLPQEYLEVLKTA
ncbi:hypothetical protein GWK36_06285 [Caldichromatium japonicum]|uniref:Uncharacterized protein n=1 Tax=Caldichromatium japonicum TaxID=2699430 RepID=A0A6G7VCP5_9GAMM|nr:hypothetical protein [Caldichromatium japonicum]QIK37655.1 hypothetical protein GWK36_06285 [Caldichromatium japonicum]